MNRDARRRLLSHVMTGLCIMAVLVALVPVALILFFVIQQGLGSLNWAFFTDTPQPVGEPGGGMANSIVGSLILISLGALFAVPIGLMSGIYIVESGGNRLATAARFAADTLNGVPSIVIGLFAYVLVVLPFKHFSALAGGVALGATRGRTVFTVVLPAALPGIITGIVLALARIAGETAPLLFTAFNNRFLSTDLTQPMSSLTVQVFSYATGPNEDWHRQAWAGALVLVTLVLICSILARLATRRLERMHAR